VEPVIERSRDLGRISTSSITGSRRARSPAKLDHR